MTGSEPSPKSVGAHMSLEVKAGSAVFISFLYLGNSFSSRALSGPEFPHPVLYYLLRIVPGYEVKPLF